MSEKPRSVTRRIREAASPYLAWPLLTGIALDYWSHPYSNQETDLYLRILTGSKADLERRAWISEIPAIGPDLAKHIGNFGPSAAAMIPFSMLGFAVREYGKSIESKNIENIGNVIPMLGLMVIVSLNIAAENLHPGSAQYLGDIQFGIAGALLSHATTTGILERTQTMWRQKRTSLANPQSSQLLTS